MVLKYFSYFILFLSILSLWISTITRFKPWQLLLGLSLILSYISDLASPVAVLSILLLYLVSNLYSKCSNRWLYVLWVLVLIMTAALEAHFIPGVHNLLVWDKVQLTPDAMPFSLYLNFDKAVAGLIILGTTLNLSRTWQEWKILLIQLSYRLPVIILIILTLSTLFGYVRFEPKLSKNLWIWIISNLFFTCVAEEGLFRGFFQKSLNQLKYKHSEIVALLVSSILFGVVHYPGGIKYLILSTVAGFLYGWTYKVTKKIEASIIAHFMLNLIHILFFTYPALIRA